MDDRFQLYTSAENLPENWNQIVAAENILLSREYFQVLEESKPLNMKCYFGGFFQKEELIGGCLFQYLDFQAHQTFQKQEISCGIRNVISRKFIRNLLLLGNNMLTGQNAFYFTKDKISEKEKVQLLESALLQLQKKIKKSSLIIIKDFEAGDITDLKAKNFKSYFQFSVQPNMILKLGWNSFEDYKNSFSKKYKLRITSAQKKFLGIQKKELELEEVKTLSKAINSLYQSVAENAAINTFFLAENHFESLKENLGTQFRIFGYFQEEILIGFYTLIINGKNIDTYFLGYEKELQKQKQLYLNMLLDMVEFGIQHQFKKIIFGRTALEIKSTVGAVPEELFGLIKHRSAIINMFVPKLFPYLEPKTAWIQRRPFKQD